MDYSSNILYVGLMGPAGSGKTTTANLLAPTGIISLNQEVKTLPQHYTLATPIYDIVGAKRNTEGADKQSRTMYQLHDILHSLIGAAVDYDTLVETVYDVYAASAGGKDDSKPRSFMQWVGDVCRSHYEDCFVDHLLRRVRWDYRAMQKDLLEAGQDDDFLMIAYISDVRRLNEINKIRSQPHSLLIRFEAPIDVLNDRILNRDGRIMNESEWAHPTETEANDIDHDQIDLVIDTSEITLRQQAENVQQFVKGYLGISEIENPTEKISKV